MEDSKPVLCGVCNQVCEAPIKVGSQFACGTSHENHLKGLAKQAKKPKETKEEP